MQYYGVAAWDSPSRQGLVSDMGYPSDGGVVQGGVWGLKEGCAEKTSAQGPCHIEKDGMWFT